MTGEIVEALRNGMFRIQLDNGHETLGYTAGKMRRFRIRMNPGDRLLAISMAEQKCEDVTRGPKCEEISGAEKIQLYLDQAHVGGQIHYLIERPSYPPETRYYYADLDHLASVNSLTVRDLYLNLIGLVYLFI